MLSAIRKMRAFRDRPAPPTGVGGTRMYVVGDVHGRDDLLQPLLTQIEADSFIEPATRSVCVFLGDLIDRGPDSSAVVARLLDYRPANLETVFLRGNHEDLLLRVLAGEERAASPWLRVGGIECLESYGVARDELRWADGAAVREVALDAIPAPHIEFLRSFGSQFRFGDYLLVHAGIRPGIPLEEQRESDLLWIREPFLADRSYHGAVIVHGHTPVEVAVERNNRICIDTGAWFSSVLTALVIEEGRRWYLTAQPDEVARKRAWA